MRSIFLSSVFIASLAQAQSDCASVIKLSKVSSATVSSAKEVQANAKYFCTEYKKHLATEKSANFGASYKFLSASYGKSGASIDVVASRYCSAEDDYSAKENAYQSYVETIAPEAYASYNACISASSSGVRWTVNPEPVSPEILTIYGAYASTTSSGPTTVSYSAADGVSCKWNGVESKPDYALAHAKTVRLECKRTDVSQRSRVEVSWLDTGDLPKPLSIPWPAYRRGEKVDDLAELQDALRGLSTRLDSDAEALRKRVVVPTQQRTEAATGMGVHVNATREAVCAPGNVAKGIQIHYGGTCLGQCNLDSGVVKQIVVVCSPLEIK